MIISRRIILRMRNISDESCREYENTVYIQFVFENLAICDRMLKNIVQPTGQMATWRMRIQKQQLLHILSVYVCL